MITSDIATNQSNHLSGLADAPFHVVTVGWGARLVEGFLDRVRVRTRIRFSHIVVTPEEVAEFRPGRDGSPVQSIWLDSRGSLPPVDREFLRSLEGEGIPTIHNMILADRVVRRLPYNDALACVTFLAHRFEAIYREQRPSVVVGAFDGLHNGIGLAVAKKLGIPWYGFYLTTLPQGFCGFCAGMTPETVVPLKERQAVRLHEEAARTIEEYRTKRIVVLAYESASDIRMVLRRLPHHLNVALPALKRLVTGRFNKYTEYPVWKLANDYFRKRSNMLTFPKRWFCNVPPETPYVFFGLQMQPESSLDTWAPFYVNQFNVVELLARSIPPTHQLLVKLHKSDADNYSRRDLSSLRRIPGVRLVSPFAPSRTFIARASLVAAIQGTMAVEAALLSKPVLMFGDSAMLRIPGVTRVDALRDLPNQVRRLLAQEPPSRETLETGFASYLSLYGPGCYYDWNRTPSEAEIDNIAGEFLALRDYTLLTGA